MKKLLTLLGLVSAMCVGSAQADVLLSWDFTGASNVATWNSTANDPSVSISTLGRGAGAPASTANNSFRTVGFKDNGISLTNTDYFEFKITTSASDFSLTSFDMYFAGTASFAASPGVTNAWAYSLDGGTNFTLLPSFMKIGGGAANYDLSTESALQNITATNSVTFRYYASGQTTTGGWGFNSPGAGTNGLVLNGTIVPEPTTYAMLVFAGVGLSGFMLRRRR